MRKKLCLTIIVLFSTLLVLGQPPNSVRRFRKYFLENEHYGISKIPITNRHYITYLSWNISVYGGALPDKDAIFINRKYFDDIEFEEKDHFRRMGFQVIGENSFNRPIVALYNTDQENVKMENKIYRMAYNKNIYFKYWP